MRTILLLAVAAFLSSCGIPPNPAITAHAGGGPLSYGYDGRGYSVPASSTLNDSEARKAEAFFGR